MEKNYRMYNDGDLNVVQSDGKACKMWGDGNE
jgi:hypothetical protein